jgi:3-oxoacyl-[acyl-carrier protein] reductase
MTQQADLAWLRTLSPAALTGKRVLITGASGGIGGALAQAFYRAGAHVCLSGRRQDALDHLRRQLLDQHLCLANEGGGAVQTPCGPILPAQEQTCHTIPLDLADTASIPDFYQRVEQQFGPIDILVNNAGLTKDALGMRMDDACWRQVIEVNLNAAFFLTRQALRPMVKQRWGRIITITSVVAFTGNPGQANYCAAKAGLVGMTKALALELAGRNITVNTIAPGYIQTPMTQDLPAEKLLAMIPCGRYGLPQDIAPAAVFLASDHSAYITGQTLHINGGLSMP